MHDSSKDNSKRVLRFATGGSVDDGKSTLIGRLLLDTENVSLDHKEQLGFGSKDDNGSALALITDGLKAEREQGITIDVAYRYFSTPRRQFILADVPGHEQYTRNMVSGAADANLLLLVIDASKSLSTQSKRHAFLAALCGVPRFLVAVNKMDLVDYDQSVFENIVAEFLELAEKLPVKQLAFMPVSGLAGDNVVEQSESMPWYRGPCLLQYLEDLYIDGDRNLVDFRLPVQTVLRSAADERAYAGQIVSGRINKGDEVCALPSGQRSKVKDILMPNNSLTLSSLEQTATPASISLVLEDEIDIARGDMIVRSNNVPELRVYFEAISVWLDDDAIDTSKSYYLKQGTREVKINVEKISYRIDMDTLHRMDGDVLNINDVGRVRCVASSPIIFESYERNRSTGNFVLIDPESNRTVMAGMLIDRLSERELAQKIQNNKDFIASTRNLHPDKEPTKADGGAKTLWFTGLSGSGKSTLAKQLEFELKKQSDNVYRLEGDNLRSGLNSDLGFSASDRTENIRRAAEVAALFNKAGMTVLCAFISPLKAQRDLARKIIGPDSFVEVFVDTPLEVCEQRDPHGLYKRARAGEIASFTGISSPYEAPTKAEVHIDTTDKSVEESVEVLLKTLK